MMMSNIWIQIPLSQVLTHKPWLGGYVIIRVQNGTGKMLCPVTKLFIYRDMFVDILLYNIIK